MIYNTLEGWGLVQPFLEWHYYREGIPLCKWRVSASGPKPLMLHADLDVMEPPKPNCKTCQRLRLEEMNT